MKFTNWYQKFYGTTNYNSDTYFASEAAWIASKNHLKQEILEILTENQNNLSCNGFGIITSTKGIIEKIKNL